MSTSGDDIEYIAHLLNNGEEHEAMQELRKMHGLVNRFVCDRCAFTSAQSSAPFRCPTCHSELRIKVVVEPA